MNIGARIQQVRGKMSRAEFAALLEIHPQTLYMYEKGKRVVDVDLIQQLCVRFNVSVEWLIFGTEKLQAAVAIHRDEEERLRRELEKKETLIAWNEARINTLQNELIAAQSGALRAYELAVGTLLPREGRQENEETNRGGGGK